MSDLKIPKDDAKAHIQKRIAIAKELAQRQANNITHYENFENDVRKWANVTKDLLASIFTDESAVRLFVSAGSIRGLPSTQNYMFAQHRGSRDADRLFEAMESMRKFIPQRITALETILETIDVVPDIKIPSTSIGSSRKKQQGRNVFIVHGRDEEMKQAVARTLETLDLKPIVLHEQYNRGRTIIEKFTDYSDVDFAIVLISPDDIARDAQEPPGSEKSRARQNVILELGFFLGKLGRSNVLPLYRRHDNFDMPSDYDGVLFTEYDPSGAWKLKLVQELTAASIDVDANKLMKSISQ